MKKFIFALLAVSGASLVFGQSETGAVYTGPCGKVAVVETNRNTWLAIDTFVSSTPDSKMGDFWAGEFRKKEAELTPDTDFSKKRCPINVVEFRCPEEFQCTGPDAFFATTRGYFNRTPVVVLVYVKDSFWGPDSAEIIVLDPINYNLVWDRYGWVICNRKFGKINLICEEN